jgi:hypothetical protein
LFLKIQTAEDRRDDFGKSRKKLDNSRTAILEPTSVSNHEGVYASCILQYRVVY